MRENKSVDDDRVSGKAPRRKMWNEKPDFRLFWYAAISLRN